MYNDTPLSDPALVDAVKRIMVGKHDQEDVDRVMNSGLGDSVEEAEGADTAYEKFFMKALKKHGYNSPEDIPDDKKKEFFDYIDKNWKAKGETVIKTKKTKTETKKSPGMTKSGRSDGRTKAYKETVKRLMNKKQSKNETRVKTSGRKR
jgi:hypothetical protein|tara:strand:+ start:22 stop:468 length:447 start_codon:yes stop_codon:yes gene_type:complete